MDKLKGMANKYMNKEQQKPQEQQGGQSAANNDDYVDKGLAGVEKKFGMSQSRETNEKITDKARGMFEKATGKKVPDKVSN